MKSLSKIEVGGWSPALKQMAIKLMDKILNRPCTSAISDPRLGNLLTLHAIKDKLSKKKYSTVEEWKNEVIFVLTPSPTTNLPQIENICLELKEIFLKHYALIDQLSKFEFRDALNQVASEIPSH